MSDTIDLSLISYTVDQQIAARDFIVAAETVTENIPLQRVRAGKMTETTVELRRERQKLMSKVVRAALEKGDIGVLRNIVGRFMGDLTVDLLEDLEGHPELGDLLHEDAFSDAPTLVR